MIQRLLDRWHARISTTEVAVLMPSGTTEHVLKLVIYRPQRRNRQRLYALNDSVLHKLRSVITSVNEQRRDTYIYDKHK
jgi:hypothetical protein